MITLLDNGFLWRLCVLGLLAVLVLPRVGITILHVGRGLIGAWADYRCRLVREELAAAVQLEEVRAKERAALAHGRTT